jgi:hypothetical protein
VKRRAINLLTALSLLLCVLIIGFWIKSFWQYDQISLQHQHRWELTLEKGGFTFAVESLYPMADITPAYGLPRFRRTGPAEMFSPRWQLLYTNDPLRVRLFPSGALGFGGEKWFTDLTIPSRKTFVSPVVGTGQEIERHTWFFPAWFAVALTALPPGWWICNKLGKRKEHRRKNHLCESCGYDLRATPDRCPECGTIPAKIPV